MVKALTALAWGLLDVAEVLKQALGFEEQRSHPVTLLRWEPTLTAFMWCRIPPSASLGEKSAFTFELLIERKNTSIKPNNLQKDFPKDVQKRPRPPVSHWVTGAVQPHHQAMSCMALLPWPRPSPWPTGPSAEEPSPAASTGPHSVSEPTVKCGARCRSCHQMKTLLQQNWTKAGPCFWASPTTSVLARELPEVLHTGDR